MRDGGGSKEEGRSVTEELMFHTLLSQYGSVSNQSDFDQQVHGVQQASQNASTDKSTAKLT